jgi:erythromycin esterase-like protein
MTETSNRQTVTVARDDADEVADIRRLATPLRRTADLDRLIDRIGDAHYVLLGEASHGTADYYGWRAAITRRLVADHGFSFVAVEGDWPDCALIDAWVKDRDPADVGASATEVLRRFDRWPTWMWANTEVAAFASWLRHRNRATGARVGFYGLDVYSLWDSLRAVLGYLGEQHPAAVAAAHEAMACFEPYKEDPQRYAWSTTLVPDGCADEVVELLIRLRTAVSPDHDGYDDPDAAFDARQNAEVLAGAERYYRTMVRADSESWNIRDCHMADTLDRLVDHHGPDARAIVWEHNTHVGDARATDMAAAGMVNVGQLTRERHAADGVVLVGFGGHHGTVIAGDSWGAPYQRMTVPPPPAGTHEDILHRALGEPALLIFPDDADATDLRQSPWLGGRRGHRAIGVVYDPRRDARGNWVPTRMGARYDAFVSLDATTALTPLHPETPAPHAEQETYPWTT